MSQTSSSFPTALAGIAGQFAIDGHLVDITPFGSGHINDTYACRFRTRAGERRWVLQRINHTVFREPERLMENVGRVTAHIRAKVERVGGDPGREVLSFVPLRAGGLLRREDDGTYWRVCGLIEGTRTFDVPERPEQVREAARAFGQFQAQLADLPGARLHETIPRFHDTAERLRTLARAVERDPCNRAADARAEVRFAMERERMAATLGELQAAGRLPERTTHNDTKLNNVLFDTASGRALCVIDLDTVMPGLALYDFGDMVRTGASTAAEDEPDVGRVGLDLEAFERMAQGYLEALSGTLVPLELEHLAFSALVITLEQGIRFLTDYLEGDTYYKVRHARHNLERCRTQFALVGSMEAGRERMEAIVSARR
jgi:aminoglycoside phosphotransferase (APT) family kinase protein